MILVLHHHTGLVVIALSPLPPFLTDHLADTLATKFSLSVGEPDMVWTDLSYDTQSNYAQDLSLIGRVITDKDL